MSRPVSLTVPASARRPASDGTGGGGGWHGTTFYPAIATGRAESAVLRQCRWFRQPVRQARRRSPPVRWRGTSPAHPAARLKSQRPGRWCRCRRATSRPAVDPAAGLCTCQSGALELEDDPPQNVPVRDRPIGHWAATISSSRFSNSRSDRAATTWQSWPSPFSAMKRRAPSWAWMDHSG